MFVFSVIGRKICSEPHAMLKFVIQKYHSGLYLHENIKVWSACVFFDVLCILVSIVSAYVFSLLTLFYARQIVTYQILSA